MRLLAASTEQNGGTEEEACGYAEAPGYVLTCYKCCETEIRPKK